VSQQILEFFVKDTGIGIKPEVQKTIFDRFMQADKSIQYEYGGAGLGLSISKGLAEILGGQIRVESEPGKGSAFFFEIPYQPAEKIFRSATVSQDIEKENTILVAEDQENNYLLIKELLSHTKLQLIRAHNGKEAIELCQKNPKIRLVLMDIKMPVMDGHTAAIEIKKLLPRLPVIALSAYALETEIQIYKDEAFDDYITKPLNPDELLLKIKNYIPG
jgi:CheY-like chemotaxis protein